MRNEIAGKRLIRVPEVLRRVGFSRTTMYELIKEGRFPDKVIIGARCVAFVESEIDAWIDNAISSSRIKHK
ncbi:TPA: AlpA family transcriptional regulator [Citrobacter koseri]|uniref:helix-turn-helix transcriptional regulator n=2 Tax=Citrobacter koseri TaxID=545 RepID=UPI000D7CD17D|nr:AlpA family transcriptional regulator [Citrobacter koseri]MBJ8940222.1 AlpA family transcriptional regulator [Citrobacter koseri]PYZ79222.1 DNA-binding protein [Citrobacter koseri]HAT3901976.1 AlpA family transcriptional regulator [Citrobacter koseri]HAU5601296.1 AlpA family transcriptional regulator [Citrobacter koseri]HCB2270085.1 AlpA family transcriptional regulator [Citrobacter koseri]